MLFTPFEAIVLQKWMRKGCRSYYDQNFVTWTVGICSLKQTSLLLKCLSYLSHSDRNLIFEWKIFLKLLLHSCLLGDHVVVVGISSVITFIIGTDWWMYIYLCEHTDGYCLPHSFSFPHAIPIFILLITLCINVWCVVNSFCVFFKAAIASGSAILMAKSSPTNIKGSEFICVKWLRRGRKWGTVLRCSFGWVNSVKKKKRWG